ncbi:hypothetical protein CRE_17213 [Caenorhabditis remanei]|uniref:Tudor domain-containing protein n=2 Tax=Caenorhabditis remanei TaxID=31234 RepID=E3MA43_CAERE|nr:hypothetical protein CRE_17213 [Caenorhabditis remanei]
MRLEATSFYDNQYICPAEIVSVHGRVLKIKYNGHDDANDEYVDIDSHNLLPAGWCEIHGYQLQYPRENTEADTPVEPFRRLPKRENEDEMEQP